MSHSLFLKSLLVFISIGIPTIPFAQETNLQPPYAGGPSSWSSFARGGAVYQFDTDLDEDGSYNTTRFTIQTGAGYSWDTQSNVSFSIGYSYDGYDFSGDAGLGSLNPWEDIHTISLGVPMRKAIDNNWTAFMIPSIRSTGESGAKFDDTLTGGVLGGFSYRFNDKLTLGPGIGVISQLEDSATVIPILIIDWKINDKWSLNTGRGLGATLGPGLTLNFQPNSTWRFGVGGRYEKLRFRLDKNGRTAGGVGEDSSFPVFVNGTYSIDPKANLSIVGGVELGGELKVEDKDGQTIEKESYDTGVFLGVTFNKRF
ncbi:DUF6268 family outer membrane beta-barrel protein [Desulfogranum marinum]|uniref:DUF6268 family outer membrane beta-barrel protein n=1 Tax=Desulfogranum marinum TaxID=453220 RepID=UPI001965E36F|nr:DUF6268 family outer membrane beta-barrel protein [Desulfogranum marinum]MBM9512155.1 hypothetical protein [Desulfogranum marinum]